MKKTNLLFVLVFGVLYFSNLFAAEVSMRVVSLGWKQSRCHAAFNEVLIGSKAGMPECGRIEMDSACTLNMDSIILFRKYCAENEMAVHASRGMVECATFELSSNCKLSFSPMIWRYRSCHAYQNEIAVGESGGFLGCKALSLEAE